jgi:hypothetical protein
VVTFISDFKILYVKQIIHDRSLLAYGPGQKEQFVSLDTILYLKALAYYRCNGTRKINEKKKEVKCNII